MHDDSAALEAIGRRLCWMIVAASVLGLTLGGGAGWALYRLGATAARAFGAP